MDSCLFCRMVRGEIPVDRVYEDEHVLAFRDIQPQAPVHVLVIPRAHRERMLDVEPELWGKMQEGVRQVAQKLGITDFRLVVNSGAQAGQTVFHCHLHLLAGRTFVWPPG